MGSSWPSLGTPTMASSSTALTCWTSTASRSQMPGVGPSTRWRRSRAKCRRRRGKPETSTSRALFGRGRATRASCAWRWRSSPAMGGSPWWTKTVAFSWTARPLSRASAGCPTGFGAAPMLARSKAPTMATSRRHRFRCRRARRQRQGRRRPQRCRRRRRRLRRQRRHRRLLAGWIRFHRSRSYSSGRRMSAAASATAATPCLRGIGPLSSQIATVRAWRGTSASCGCLV
mmetsp:Transcript_3346/g.8039  ORF Transcript_3346/g.8039 Transcript_3346/m.8039 type:complete len:230 (-) Transcript_3346:2569-3258(-)